MFTKNQPILDEGLPLVRRSAKVELEIKSLKTALKEVLRRIKYSRIALYILSAVTLFGVVFTLYKVPAYNIDAAIEGIVFLLIYLILAEISRKNAIVAFTFALLLYVGLEIVNAMFQPFSIFSGLAFKLILVFFLIQGIYYGIALKRLQKRLIALGDDGISLV